MLKEIFEQPTAARETMLGRVSQDTGKVFLEEMKITDAQLAAVERVTILACGTSWHAALVGKFMIEQLARAAGRSRLRLGVPLSQPDRRAEHAGRRHHAVGRDRRHAGRAARGEARRRRAASRSATSSAAWRRARPTARSTRTPGPEIGVASTKAFTSQLVALYLLALRLGQVRGDAVARGVEAARRRAAAAAAAARADAEARAGRSRRSPARFHNRTDFLYLGRGINYPIALEGALKLKEISYIHAEGYPAGEMKHGPIALIDEQMPVVAHRAARSRVREDDRQHAGSEGARRLGHRADHARRRQAGVDSRSARATSSSSCRARPSC